jgi:uncharacterized membrane protein YeiH
MLGISLMAFVTALGGGIIRDTIAGNIPYAFVDSTLPIIVLVTLFVAIGLKLHKKENIERKELFVLSDSIGLISFSISGALVALHVDMNFFGVIILAFITAIGGGIIRDVLINHVPMVLTKDFYGTVSIIIAILMYILNSFELLNIFSISGVFFIGLLLRILARRYSWTLPRLR